MPPVPMMPVRQVLSVVAGETIKNSTVLDHAMLQALNPIFKIPDCMKKTSLMTQNICTDMPKQTVL